MLEHKCGPFHGVPQLSLYLAQKQIRHCTGTGLSLILAYLTSNTNPCAIRWSFLNSVSAMKTSFL